MSLKLSFYHFFLSPVSRFVFLPLFTIFCCLFCFVLYHLRSICSSPCLFFSTFLFHKISSSFLLKTCFVLVFPYLFSLSIFYPPVSCLVSLPGLLPYLLVLFFISFFCFRFCFSRSVCVCCHSIYSGRQVLCGRTCTSRGHTRFLRLPLAVFSLIFLARQIQPFLSLVDSDVECCVLTI